MNCQRGKVFLFFMSTIVKKIKIDFSLGERKKEKNVFALIWWAAILLYSKEEDVCRTKKTKKKKRYNMSRLVRTNVFMVSRRRDGRSSGRGDHHSRWPWGVRRCRRRRRRRREEEASNRPLTACVRAYIKDSKRPLPIRPLVFIRQRDRFNHPLRVHRRRRRKK